MKRSLAVAGCLVALLPAAAAGSVAGAPKGVTPAEATAAFGRLLHRLYGGIDGYWTCPARQAFGGSADCLGEVRAGRRWHLFGARAHEYHGIVDFHLPQARTWVRRWTPFSRRFILRSHESAPGVVSVNGPAYDWGWLARCAAGVEAGPAVACGAYDGDGSGWARFYSFSCSLRGAVVTCRNALGDAMRWRRRA